MLKKSNLVRTGRGNREWATEYFGAVVSGPVNKTAESSVVTGIHTPKACFPGIVVTTEVENDLSFGKEGDGGLFHNYRRLEWKRI